MKQLLILLLTGFLIGGVNAQKTTYSRSSKNQATIIDPVQFEYMPKFPGGEKVFWKFLSQNLKWPKSDDGEAYGRVIISFIVEKDGRLTSFKVERSLGKDFDAEALRVLRKSPKWVPGVHNGKPVRCGYTVPINFMFSD